MFRRNVTGGLTGELDLLPLNRNFTPAGRSVGLTAPALNANYPVWMPDSKEVVFSAQERVWRVRVTGQGEADATAVRRRGLASCRRFHGLLMAASRG